MRRFSIFFIFSILFVVAIATLGCKQQSAESTIDSAKPKSQVASLDATIQSSNDTAMVQKKTNQTLSVATANTPGSIEISASSKIVTDQLPIVGSYGFNWLKPKTTKCRKIMQSDIRTYKSCEISRQGFGGEIRPTHVCSVNDENEWIIYVSNSQCQSEFETMQANAP
jgi:hypothetical protein